MANSFASPVIPTEISDPVNARILAVSEDRIAGFINEPFAQIAFAAELPEEVVIERLRAMLSAGVIRRIRQTLMRPISLRARSSPGACLRRSSTPPSATWLMTIPSLATW